MTPKNETIYLKKSKRERETYQQGAYSILRRFGRQVEDDEG